MKAKRWMRHALFGLGNITLIVDRYWSDERHRSVEGWVASDTEDVEAVEVCAGNKWVSPEPLVSRPDITGSTGNPIRSAKGFAFQFAHGAPMSLTFRVKQKGRWSRYTVKGQAPDCAEKLDVPSGQQLFDEFIREVNERHLHVLEIGSRIVSPGSVSKRSLFPGAASYTGFDCYPDDNTDVVGDAHRLAEFVGEKKFDAVFSIAVIEHLAMPWIVAREINRVLRTGGITYHGTVFAWPTHERPWDFWRLSDEGLKVLFSPALGFEVLGAGMFDPVSMHFRVLRDGQAGFPHGATYASSAILARKQADVNEDEFRWPSSLENFVGPDSQYPPPK